MPPGQGPFIRMTELQKVARSGKRVRAKSYPLLSLPSNPNGATENVQLPVGHLLGHVQNQLAVAFFRLAQQATKLVKEACFFADAAPRDVVGRLALGKIR